MTTTLLEESESVEAESDNGDASSEPFLITRTIADLIDDLGGIDPARIRIVPLPGTAIGADAEKYKCELIDGTLVRKDMAFDSYYIGAFLLSILFQFVESRKFGAVLGEAGFMELKPGLVQAPDVSFISWERIHSGTTPERGIPKLVPDLAVEVLSPGNTKAEMARKRREYFAAGVRLVWELQPKTRTAVVYTADDEGTSLGADASLDGVDVVPGFTMPLATIFGVLDNLSPA